MPVKALVFDVGNVLFHWSPRALYQRLIPDDQALEAFLRDVLTPQWHFQHDAGRDFAETSAELIAQFPEHEPLIRAWGAHFAETITGPVAGMTELVAELARAGVPLFGITNFSHEFWPPFRAQQDAVFAPFRDIIVSGVEKLTKPDPAIYHLAHARFGLEPGEGLFVDDSAANVQGAGECGFATHHFAGESASAAVLRARIVAEGLLPR